MKSALNFSLWKVLSKDQMWLKFNVEWKENDTARCAICNYFYFKMCGKTNRILPSMYACMNQGRDVKEHI